MINDVAFKISFCIAKYVFFDRFLLRVKRPYLLPVRPTLHHSDNCN